MAAEVSGVVEVSPWLKSMPVAPEYHPSLAEFQDPIAYIFKIEKEASKYGICKIVPPVPCASKKTIVTNLNKSLLARSESGPTFTTRQQQIGFCPRKHRPVQKPVWQSGERYSLTEFEAKARNFERNYLKKYTKKSLNALEMETLYWNAMVDKPFQVEYANDMPGSAFVPYKSGGKRGEGAGSVGETEWNMRRVSRENLSLLRFMKEEIPGVTSPMVYVAMMFSWFAWHVEDHDLHSMNYLHMGSGKTWYGVPREAAVAFEEVIREHGYGGEINPLVTFATLGEKTTVMSPEVLLSAGVPCCRLVQNAGEFVVTFPRAYHSGFSHGFNCGEAANIATPEWLRVAREAAVRRAATNCPPMVSHFQLLYDLALSLCSRVPKSIAMEPRSSRLKDRKRGEGEMLIKELFFQDMMQNNDMLHILGEGSSVVLLPQNSLSQSFYAGFQSNSKSKLFPSLCSPDLELKPDAHEDFTVNTKQGVSRTFSSLFGGVEQKESEVKKASQSEQGLFSCVACGILCFACVAIVKPTDAAAQYLMSGDCSILSNWGESDYDPDHVEDVRSDLCSAFTPRKTQNGLVDGVRASDSKARKEPSSLGLLALAYGNSSDSDEEETEDNKSAKYDDPENGHACDNTNSNQNLDCSDDFRINDSSMIGSNHSTRRFRHQMTSLDASVTLDGNAMLFSSKSDEDSSRLHVFCLHHAMQVQKRLNRVGGAHVFLVCHPDYPKLESEAKKVAEELERDHIWNEISFREATDEDEETIRLALESENAIHGNGDWAVKLGINLFYSANLSRSPLYCKQMHYNFVIYSAFGRSSSSESEVEGPGVGRQKKIIVAGKWCGKVWMSSQAHPLLVKNDLQDDEPEKKPLEAARILSAIRRTSRKRKKINHNAENLSCKKEEKTEKLEKSSSFKRVKRKQIGLRRLKEEKSESGNVECEFELTESLSESLGGSCKQIRSKRVAHTKLENSIEAENLGYSSEEIPLSKSWKQIKKKRDQQKQEMEDEAEGGPSTRLRKRPRKPCKETKPVVVKKQQTKKCSKSKMGNEETGEYAYACDMEGCTMSFGSKQELVLHKKNICPVKGCGKKFFSHKYLVQHRRVHVDDRPLKCPWKGCKMTFKWAWARTEHIRVHTGARPYVCTESGCGQTFRFVSDFSRHKRKTGHAPKKARG